MPQAAGALAAHARRLPIHAVRGVRTARCVFKPWPGHIPTCHQPWCLSEAAYPPKFISARSLQGKGSSHRSCVFTLWGGAYKSSHLGQHRLTAVCVSRVGGGLFRVYTAGAPSPKPLCVVRAWFFSYREPHLDCRALAGRTAASWPHRRRRPQHFKHVLYRRKALPHASFMTYVLAPCPARVVFRMYDV